MTIRERKAEEPIKISFDALLLFSMLEVSVLSNKASLSSPELSSEETLSSGALSEGFFSAVGFFFLSFAKIRTTLSVYET